MGNFGAASGGLVQRVVASPVEPLRGPGSEGSGKKVLRIDRPLGPEGS